MILSAALVCAGCSQKESVDSSDGSDVAALALLNMDASGEDGLTWEDRKGSNGNYTYTNLTIDPQDDDDESVVTIGTLTLSNVGMIDAAPTFGSMKAEGLRITDEDTLMQIERMSMTDPTPETAMAMTKILSGFTDLDISDDSNIGFGELTLSKISASSSQDGGSMTIGSINMEDVDKNYAKSVSLKDLEMLTNEGGVQDGRIALASLEMNGVDLASYSDMEGAAALDPAKSMDRIAGMNPYKPGVENLTLSGLEFKIAGMSGGMDSATRRSKTRGGVTVVTQDMSPLTLTPQAGAQGPGQMLRAMGYETLTLTGKSVMELDEANDRLSVKENYLKLNDGFNLSFDYDVTGYAKMLAKRTQIAAENGEAETYTAESMSALMDMLLINSAGVTLDDQGLTDRVINFMAESQNTTPDRIRKQATGGMLMFSMFMEDDAKAQITRQSIEALTEFIKEPGTLKLGFYPETPIPVSALDAASRGEGDAKTLGFKASAE